MSNKNDLTGQRFGRLIVLEEVEERCSDGSKKWLCECDCGKEKIISGGNLKRGRTKSCGCLVVELSVPRLKAGSASDIVESTRVGILASNKLYSNNTSGVKGVSFDKRLNKWNAYLKFKKTRVLNEFFENKQDAINARKEAEEKYFKPILEKYAQK